MTKPKGLPGFFRELRRRKVLRTLAAYLLMGLAVLEGTEILVPRLGLPDVVADAVLLALVLGLPVTLVISWIYDWQPGGWVRDADDAAHPSAPEGSVPPARELDPNAVAVLPFDNLTSAGDDDYFSEGVTEEIIAALCRVPELRVISRTSVQGVRAQSASGVRDLGRRLGVALIVEGSVRRQGGRVRIVAKAVEVDSEVTVWSETYDRELEDIFAVQSDVASQVAGAMAVRLTPDMTRKHRRQRTDDPEAYDLFLRALYLWNHRSGSSFEEGLTLLERALTRDPGFALAHAGVAMTQLTRGIYGHVAPEVVLTEALPAAERALAIDPLTAEALVARGCIRAMYRWEWDAAEADMAAAVDANPSYATAHQWRAVNVLAPRGRFAEAGEAVARAKRLDPVSPAVGVTEGVLAYFRRDFAASLEAYDRVARMHPRFAPLHLFRGQVHAAMGEHDRAVAELERGAEALPGSVEMRATLAYARALSGATGAARDTLTALESGEGWVSPVFLAQIRSALGDAEGALDHLEAAADLRAPDLAWIGVRPTFDPLRTTPRFQALVDRMGLPG